MYKKRAWGFSLVELVIVIVIIGVIAAIAVPRVTQATKGAGETALSSNLSVLRNAIELYASEHLGKYPGKNGAGTFGGAGTPEAFKAQLTMFSDVNGDCATGRSTTHPLGPYLAKDIPPQPVGENKDSNTVSVSNTTSACVTDVAGGFGWVYSYETGEIIANSDKANDAAKQYKDY